MYQPTLGRFMSRDPLGEDGVDVLYDNNSFGQSLTMMRNTYGYVDNNPANAVDPSGLQRDFGGACAGTNCDEFEGIKTDWNPNAPAYCFPYCQQWIVNAHEAAHRANMGPCCDLRNKCLAFASMGDLREDKRDRYRNACFRAWSYWKSVNRVSLERKAAVKSCEAAKYLLDLKEERVKGCCDVARSKVNLELCKNKDPNAKIECCPFKESGEIDLDCFNTLKRLYREQNPELGE